MSGRTVSATFSTDQINELIAEPIYFVGPRPQIELIFESETVTFDRNNMMFWKYLTRNRFDSELKAEFDSWEAASDDDLAQFETNLE